MKWLIRCVFFLFFLISASSAFCAAPVFHVYIAEKWAEIFEDYDEVEKKNFIVGTLFPDIRYLGVIHREETHETGIDIDDIIKTEDPFVKGKRLHAFVDEVRTRLLEKTDIMSLLYDVPDEHKITFLKFLEDAVLYSQGDWAPTCKYLRTFVADPAIDYKVTARSLKKWHLILRIYFSRGPVDLLARLSEPVDLLARAGYLGVPPHLIKKWAILIPALSQESFVQNYVSDLVNEFITIFEGRKI